MFASENFLANSGLRSFTLPGCSRWVLLWIAALLTGCVSMAQVSFTATQFGLAVGTWNAPSAIAVDGHGNLYVADTGDNRVVELPASGTGFSSPVTILSGLSGPGGVAADWNGNVYVSDTGNGNVWKLPISGQGFGEPISLATGLSSPNGLALDSSRNVYVAVSGSGSIVEIPVAHGAYLAATTVATGFNNPMGVALDAARNLLIADTGNNRVVKQFLSASGYTTQQALWENLNAPEGLAVDESGNLYVAVNGGQQVLEKTWQAGAKRFGPSETIGSAMTSPAGIAVDSSGQLFVGDAGSSRVLEIESGSVTFGAFPVGEQGGTLTYNFTVSAGTTLSAIGIYTQGVVGGDFADGGSSTCAAQTYAADTVCGVSVSFTPLAAGTRMGAIELWSDAGSALATAYISGVGELQKAAFLPGSATAIGSQLSGPMGVAVDGSGNVYIADSGNNRVVELPWTGAGYGAQTVVPMSGLVNPMGVAVDGAGNLYVVSNGNDKVIYLPWTPTGFGMPGKVGTGHYGPSNVTVGTDGTVYLTDTLNQTVDKIVWTGNSFGIQKEVGNYHKAPVGIAVDGSGNLYYSDPYQNGVSWLPWLGSRYDVQRPVPVSGLSFPAAVAVDSNADLFILDSVENSLIMLPRIGDAFGAQITVATGFNAPSGLTIDSKGVIYVADTGNNQVVRIDMSVPGGLTYDSTYLGSTSMDSPQAALVGNIGNLPLSLTAISYAPDFVEATAMANTCSSGMSLAASEWCELPAAFTPSATGSLSESLSVTDDTLGVAGTLQPIPVSGVAMAKAAQTINFGVTAGAAYGSAPIALAATASSGLPVSFTVVSGPGVLSGNGQMLRLVGAGMVVVQGTQSGNGQFTAAPAVTVGISVAPATLTVTPASVTATYGAIPSNLAYTISGFVRGDSVASAVTGQPAIAGTMSAGSGVGSYTLSASPGTLAAANYKFQFASGTLIVVPAVLQVVLPSRSHCYGTPPPALAWTLVGFVNGDGPGVVSGAPLLTTTANSGTPVGTYPITATLGSLAAANYTFHLGSGNLLVNPALLTVAATSQQITYGASMPKLGYTISGLVNGDSTGSAVAGQPLVSTQAPAQAGAGSYSISVSLGTMTAKNYSFVFVSGTLLVEKAQIVVTPGNVATTYGLPMPPFSYTFSGLVNGDTAATAVSGAPALSSTATARSVSGTYAISAAAGSLVAKNYTFTFANGTLTVGKAILTVTPLPASATYGGGIPHLSATYSGLVNGDGVSSLAGAPQLTTQAVPGSPAGTYAIATGVGTLTSAKYSFKLQSGVLTVNPAVLTVEAVAATTTYGNDVPKFAYKMRGFVHGDAAAQVSGAPALQSSANSGSPAGKYPIAATVGTLKAANYIFAFEDGELTIDRAPLTIAPNDIQVTYGAALPQITYTAQGLVNGDSMDSAVSGVPQTTAQAKVTSPVGAYSITVSAGTLTSRNYNLSFKSGKVTVGKAQLIVSANDCSMTEGTSIPSLTYSVKGLMNGDTLTAAAKGKPEVTTAATGASKAGSYSIVAAQGTMQASNYALSFENGTLTVNQ